MPQPSRLWCPGPQPPPEASYSQARCPGSRPRRCWSRGTRPARRWRDAGLGAAACCPRGRVCGGDTGSAQARLWPRGRGTRKRVDGDSGDIVTLPTMKGKKESGTARLLRVRPGISHLKRVGKQSLPWGFLSFCAASPRQGPTASVCGGRRGPEQNAEDTGGREAHAGLDEAAARAGATRQCTKAPLS